MGQATDIYRDFFNRLNINCVLSPKITKKTFELGNERIDELMCMTGDTNITIKDFTNKKIKDIKVGDKVLTHKGRFKKVINIFHRQYKGNILGIDCGGLLNFNITPEHPIYSLRRKKIICHKAGKQLPIICHPNKKNSQYCNKHKNNCQKVKGNINFSLEFNQASDLNKGDFIAIPIPSETIDKKSLLLKETYKPQTKYRLDKIDYSPEILRLSGYFLAEGCYLYNNRKIRTRTGINFSFSSNENFYINDVFDIMKNNFESSFSSHSQGDNCTQLSFFNKALANGVYQLCGEYSYGKKINQDLMFLEPEKQSEILKGFFRGDGHQSKLGDYSCATISEDLAYQLFWLLVRNNIKPSFFKLTPKNKKPYYVSKLMNNEDIQKIDTQCKRFNRKRDNYNYIKIDDYILVQIMKIEKSPFKGNVYNLEVEEDNSYVANGLIVHNCLPVKVTMGSFRESLDKGYKNLLMWDNCGVCRMKCYWSLQKHVLKKLGYEFEMIPLSPRNFIKQLYYLSEGHTNLFKIFKSAKIAYSDLKKMENEKLDKDIVIGLIGEIYTINCPEVNMNLIKKLDKFGAGYKNYVTNHEFVSKVFPFSKKSKFRKEASEYMPHKEKIGGHAFQSIVHLLEAIDEGLDGIIHILPFPCSPEAVVSPLLDIIAEKNNFPLIHLIFDEHSGEAGLETRLEAFIDMIKLKKDGMNKFKKVKLGQKTKKAWIGLDCGSVSTKAVLLNENGDIMKHIYLETKGNPIQATQKCFKKIIDKDTEIRGFGVTGSSRKLIGKIFNADLIKNEITAQVIGCLNQCENVRSLIEIGGQDSKGILLQDGVPIFYNMNSVCAAGTGSFLAHQKERMGFDKIEDFAKCGYDSSCPTNISGRCTVFAESDLIHKQSFNKKEDLIAGLNRALVINYLKNVMKNRQLEEPIFFSGGVSCNQGVVKAFKEYLGKDIIVSEFNKLTGAIGIALLTKKQVNQCSFNSDIINSDIEMKTRFCEECGNQCEVSLIYSKNQLIGKFNDICENFQIKSQPL